MSSSKGCSRTEGLADPSTTKIIMTTVCPKGRREGGDWGVLSVTTKAWFDKQVSIFNYLIFSLLLITWVSVLAFFHGWQQSSTFPWQ